MSTLDNYRNMLRANKLRLDDELEVQAQVQEELGREVARLSARVLELKDELAAVEGEALDRFKDQDPRATVDQCKGRMIRDDRRVVAWGKLHQVRLAHDEWDAVLQAWITKGYKLADLGALYAADYFAVRTIARPDGERRREVDARSEESRSAVRRDEERGRDPRRRDPGEESVDAVRDGLRDARERMGGGATARRRIA
jgi:hypothetical protein